MSEKALKSMEEQIIGLTLHKDHVFKVDNTLGHFVDARIVASSEGDVNELWVEVELEPFDINPDAKRVYEKIKSGTRLGFSIAGILKEWEKIETKDDKSRFLITDIELLSVDLVTIPAYRASQGSLSVTSEKSQVTSQHEIYVCKQIGQILRENISIAASRGQPVAILMIGVEEPSDLMESLGRKGYEDLIGTFAKRLRGCMREKDIVARFDDAKFALLLDGAYSADVIGIVKDKILKQLSTPVEIHGQDIQVQARVGVAIYPSDGDHRKALIEHALTDMRLHQEA